MKSTTKIKPPVYFRFWFIILLVVIGFFGVLLTPFSLLLWPTATVLLILRIKWSISHRKQISEISSSQDSTQNKEQKTPDLHTETTAEVLLTPQVDAPTSATNINSGVPSDSPSDNPWELYATWKLVGAFSKEQQEALSHSKQGEHVKFQYITDSQRWAVLNSSNEIIGYLSQSHVKKFQVVENSHSAQIKSLVTDAKHRIIPQVSVYSPYVESDTKPVDPPVKKKKKSRKIPESYVVVDTETTGLSAEQNEIIEIAAIKVKDCIIVDQFSTLVKPHGTISSRITKITGITNEMVSDAPSFDEITADFLSFIEDMPIVGHNVSFDLKFINCSLQRIGFDFLSNETFDTLSLARKAFPEMENHKLQTLAEELSIDSGTAHRALADCHTTQQLLELIRKE